MTFWVLIISTTLTTVPFSTYVLLPPAYVCPAIVVTMVVGTLVGKFVGGSLGVCVGAIVGGTDGELVGAIVGPKLGAADGMLVGGFDGGILGTDVGNRVGSSEGPRVGAPVGASVLIGATTMVVFTLIVEFGSKLVVCTRVCTDDLSFVIRCPTS